MNYWLVRASHDHVDQTSRFLEENFWENGYDSKYHTSVNKIQVGDILLLANKSHLEYYGVCKKNNKNGKIIFVKKWIKFADSVYFPAKGAYIKTIVRIANQELLKTIKEKINIIEENSTNIVKNISLENFTLFDNSKIKLFSGLNIIIGENGTAKTHILKLIYSIIKSNNNIEKKTLFTTKSLSKNIYNTIYNVFGEKELKHLISFGKRKCLIDLNLSDYSLRFGFTENSVSQVNFKDSNKPFQLKNKSIVFIPAKEFLSHFKGFSWLYEERYIAFDQTFYDLCKALDAPLLKNNNSELKEQLDFLLDGEVIKQNGEFYLYRNDNKKIPISMIAEGLRRIGTISYLLANGSLKKNSILIWDEPESNLNPKLIKEVASLLLKLSAIGVQLIISTHSLFLIKEIEILKENTNNVNYTSFYLNDKSHFSISQSNNFEELDSFVLLDEELDQSDRFIEKEIKRNINGDRYS